VETVPAPDPPIVHAGTNWQPSRFDEARINTGHVLVDSVGQHARLLQVGGGTGPTLTISGGWLKVENELLIGGFGVIGDVSLTGGTLRAQTISKPSGTFSFTGGKLSADIINFSLTNSGGTLAPGDSLGTTQTNSPPINIGQTHVVGDLTLASGTLQVELAATTVSDTLVIDGIAALGGALSVSTLGGFTPTGGNSWVIMTAAGGMTGQFSSVTGGYSVEKQGNNLVLFFGSPTLAGDYNGDGIVESGDYVVWRQAMEGGGTLLNETASPGVVDHDDYLAWRTNFGAAASGNGLAELGTVPEPSGVVLFVLLFCSGWLASWRLTRKLAACGIPDVFCKISRLAEMHRELA
jgi:hypothetical protein